MAELPGVPERNGRKFKLALLALALVTLGYVVVGFFAEPLRGLFIEYVGAVMGIYTIYCGGNVGNKWVVGKVEGVTNPLAVAAQQTRQPAQDAKPLAPVAPSASTGPGPAGK